MKTLDEVITALEMCTADHCICLSGCPYSYLADGDDGCEYHAIPAMQKDALHYLKEYRKVDSNYWSEKAISELNNIADAYFLRAYREDKDELTALRAYWKEQHENAPLTWSELKQMKGRPVWIEAESLSIGVSPYWKDWYIIKSFSNDEFMYCNDGFEWGKELQGRLWQAYRKERE